MTSMRSVATLGSVSGSRLVTQNLLLGLDSGWMTGLWTVGAQIQGVLRAGGEEAARGLGAVSQQLLWGGPMAGSETRPQSLLQLPAALAALLILWAHPARPLGLCTCHASAWTALPKLHHLSYELLLVL